MKTKNTLQKLRVINQSLSEHRRIAMALVSAIIMTLLAFSGKAANVLINPGFESSPIFTSGSWSQHASETWSMASATAADLTSIKLVHSGANGLWMQGLYGNGQGGPQTSYAAQDLACIPGNTYTADAWYSAYAYCTSHIGGDDGTDPPGGCGLFQADASGNEDGWVEVLFFDSGNVLLADYKSMIITPAYVGTASGATYNGSLPVVTNALGNIYLAWADFPVTNQYDITTVTPNTDPAVAGGITNTLGAGQYITAPPGAVKVEFRIDLYQAAYEPGAPFWDDATLSQVGGPSPSIIGNLSPDGTKFFNAASTSFTFNVTSAAAGGAALPTNPTNGVGIVVNGQNETGRLQFSGPSTNLSVTLPGLESNTLYAISVSVTNSVGLVSSKTVVFDTFPTNVFIVSAEDYDYTNGLFIQNPTPTAAPAANSYYGLAGTLGADMSTYGGTGVLPGGAAELVRSDNNVAMQKAEDIQLPQYLAADDPNVYNVQIAYNNPGNWENYTRNYPTGNYLVYLRYNDNVPGSFESLNLLTSGYGTTTQTTTNLGEFISAGIGASYAWLPLTDTFGNKVIVNLPAGRNTLQLFSGGIANFVDFIFVPAGTGFPPVINNLYPNNINPPVNANIFLNVTNITYSVSSAFSTVATNNIHTLVNGVDISSLATYTGNNTNWSVSLPCPQNELITLVINAKDANGLTNQITETFDTFSQNNLMIEGVDWDFNGGQFIDNPVPTAPLFAATNSYYSGGINGTNASVFNVDYDGTYDGEVLGGYRNNDNGFQCEVSSDFVRQKFIDNFSTDYDLGYYNGGQWANYTRTFPTNNYNIYGRLAGGAGPFNNTTLALVTSGRGTTSQTTRLLGSFADANAAGWQTWHWVPMRDTNGNLATIPLGGVQTLKATSGNNVNVNFYMLVPAGSISVNLTVSISGSSIVLHFPTVAGHNYTVLYNNTLIGGTWQPLSAAVPGDGTVKTVTDTLARPARFYRLQIQ
ncbi:conserved exported hypothetical protein [Verrucomicrobia bacterium]|nr:conserved exported hypothetical protein [Verrucomicrobiota bacterium]